MTSFYNNIIFYLFVDFKRKILMLFPPLSWLKCAKLLQQINFSMLNFQKKQKIENFVFVKYQNKTKSITYNGCCLGY